MAEKSVKQQILELVRREGDDLAAIKAHLDRHDQRFDNLERQFANLDRRFDSLERDIGSLRYEIPRIVGDVMREVLRERDER